MKKLLALITLTMTSTALAQYSTGHSHIGGHFYGRGQGRLGGQKYSPGYKYGKSGSISMDHDNIGTKNSSNWGITGEVIVLETPVFSEPDETSFILDWARKGDELYIRRKGLSESPDKPQFDQQNLRGVNPVPKHLVPNNGYFETVTRDGNSGFIKAEHIKILYLDEREFLTKIKRWDWDPTDYRLEEPLEPEYPLYDHRKVRAMLSYAIGPQRKINYPYPSKIIGERFGSRKGFNFFYLSKVDFDPYNRFYFGVGATYYEATSQFEMQNGTNSNEKNRQLTLGPHFSYDAYRYERIMLTFAGGVGVNYYKTQVAVQGAGAAIEERNFSAFSISPRLGSYVSYRDLFPDTDFLFGAELQATHPFSMTAGAPDETEEAWNQQNDQIYYEIGAQFSVFIGFISKY